MLLKAWFVILLLTFSVTAQPQSAYMPRLAYERLLRDGTTEVVVLEAEAEYRFTVDADECYTPNINHNLIAVSQRDKPDQIVIYELTTQKIVNTVTWQPECFNPCLFGISSEGFLIIRTVMNPAKFTVVDIPSGKILDQNPDFSSKTYTSPLSLNTIKTLPGIMSILPFYKFSPEPGFILYERCLGDAKEGHYGYYCYGSNEFVVYDYENQQELEVLQHPPILRRDPFTDFAIRFYWSPAGRYIAYRSGDDETGNKLVYDLISDTYLDTSSIRVHYPDSAKNEIRWSPDEQKFAFMIDSRDSSFSDIGIFDVEANTFSIIARPFQLIAWEWDWLPDSTALVMKLEDNSLLQVNLDGSKTIIADNVQRISTTYNPRS